MITINHNNLAENIANNLHSHYSRLAVSTGRLSSGLRINSAADDAAGLAIRELMRSDVAALRQGARNANDAISMLQVADGALSIIDEKLIRMKELAEQAATGTYDSTQRLLIDSEFQAMANEIDRIANATDFNGIKLLDGSLSGAHDGSGLNAKGRMKIHFGSGNDSAEDYYYVEIGDCSTKGLGLRDPLMETTGGQVGNTVSLAGLPEATDNGYKKASVSSGIVPQSFIPKGSRNVVMIVNGLPGGEDDIQIFTRDGYHILGTRVPDDFTWTVAGNDIDSTADAAKFMTHDNGYMANASYALPGDASPIGASTLMGAFNDGFQPGVTAATWDINLTGVTQSYTRAGSGATMNIYYSGDYDHLESGSLNNDGRIDDGSHSRTQEKIIIDEATEDLLVIVSGVGIFDIDVTWDYMPKDGATTIVDETRFGPPIDIKTQEKAQKALVRIDDAIVRKDKIRAHLGALQNRFENTVANLTIQEENLQSAESRISDTDVALEMTRFVRNQVLTQTSVAMLSQANTMPQMLMSLLNG